MDYFFGIGHKIEEIRLRALQTLILKFEYGFLYNWDLASSKELLIKLFEWFSFQPCTEQEAVLKLIFGIFKSESGRSLIRVLSPEVIISDLQQIEPCVSSEYIPLLHEIKKYINTYVDRFSPVIVPPLNLNQYDIGTYRSDAVETTATPFNMYIQQTNTPDVQHGNIPEPNNNHPAFSLESIQSPFHPNVSSEIFDNCIPNAMLNWQPLVAPDRHVLNSIENSLKQATDPLVILHSCKFFVDVLLQDFPAEVFLQRPGIVKGFHSLLNSALSSTVTNCVVMSLQKLTEMLYVRVKYYCDPSTSNCKQEKCVEGLNSILSSPNPPKPRRMVFNGEKDFYFEAANESSSTAGDYDSEGEDSVLLQMQQLTLPHYCIQTLYYSFARIGTKPSSLRNVRSVNQEILNGLFSLSMALIKLLQSCIRPEIWLHRSDQVVQEVTNQLSILFNKLADLLEHSRLLTLSSDINANVRVNHLQLICITRLFLKSIVPEDKASTILPENLKKSLSCCLLDACLLKLFPRIHKELYSYTSSETNLPNNNYKEVDLVSNSMKVAAKFLRHGIYSNSEEIIQAMLESLPCLPYHKNNTIIKTFCEILVNKYPKWKSSNETQKSVEELTVLLLGHSDPSVKVTMYSICHLYVTNILGIDHVTKNTSGKSGECLKFLFNSAVFVELCSQGLNSDNAQIQRYSEDILHYILKSKFIVGADVWNTIIATLVPALPLLQCFGNKNTPLGRSITKMLYPDVAESMDLPKCEVIKGNLRLLFSNDSTTRNDAISRLTWMLTIEDGAHHKLPLVKSLRGPILNTLCIFETKTTIPTQTNKCFEVGSLVQVLELLSTSNVEPKIRKSACNQLCAMVEEPGLHVTFIEQGGVKIVLDIFKNALDEKQYEDYPDSVIPIVKILKNLVLFNTNLRMELALLNELYLLVIRALFLFSGDNGLRLDASILLCLLLFSDFILVGKDVQLSIVYAVADNIVLPFVCRTHWRTSPNSKSSSAESLLRDESCAAALRIQWNIAWYGSLQEIFKLEDLPSELSDFNGELRLTKYDLASLKYSSIYYCCQMYLNNIQNAASHSTVLESINGITAYLSLRKLIGSDEDLLNLSWETSLSRFLTSAPSSKDDMDLLVQILYFLRTHMNFFKKSDKVCWITTILKDSNHCLTKLLHTADENNSSAKNLNKELLMLITECASIEQRLGDAGMIKYLKDQRRRSKQCVEGSWLHIVLSIAEHLHFSDTDHFYNLAFLDWLLSCLVQITASLGWSTNPHDVFDTQEIRGTLVGCLTELVGAFHCGKGPAAATSFMGLSITRNCVLTMNHLLCEMQNLMQRGWEKYWLCETEDMNGSLQWLGTLWTSRDVILRAATLQLLAGLASSQKGATEVILGLRSSCSGGVWTGGVAILLDNSEACAVREQAAILLTNLTSHCTPMSSGKGSVLTLCYGPDSCLETNSTSEAIIALLEKYRFWNELDLLLSCLTFDLEVKKSSSSISQKNSISSQDLSQVVVTPSLIKVISWFVTNLITLDPDTVINELNGNMLVRSFFRCLTTVNFEIKDSRTLALYIDVLEMCGGICALLTKTISNSTESHSTVLHLRNCLCVLLSILNPALYFTHSSQLLYMRNRLWIHVYKLLTALLVSEDANTCYRDQGYNAIIVALQESGQSTFLEALCESISTNHPELQQAAISCLTALLRIETANDDNGPLQQILDTIQTPLTPSADIPDMPELYKKPPEFKMAGAVLSQILIRLYIMHSLQGIENAIKGGKNSILSALASLLSISKEAKTAALNEGLLELLMEQLKDLHARLSLESVDCVRRASDKKRVCPLLNDMSQIFKVLTNFMVGNDRIKLLAVSLGLADLIHKFWNWISFQRSYLTEVMKMLCTYTTECELASQSVCLTSPVAGVGPRKSPTAVSLLHCVMHLIAKEMDLVNRSHDLELLVLSFHLLQNCCHAQECRVLITKANLFQHLSRLHPAITKRQKPWESVEILWLEFLETLTFHQEGQTSVGKSVEAMELIMALTSSSQSLNRITALAILRNIAFCQANRPRLLNSTEFLKIIKSKLTSGSIEEKCTCVTIIWSLAANSQKAKFVLKTSGIEDRLHEVLKQWKLTESKVEKEQLNNLQYIIEMLKEGR